MTIPGGAQWPQVVHSEQVVIIEALVNGKVARALGGSVVFLLLLQP